MKSEEENQMMRTRTTTVMQPTNTPFAPAGGDGRERGHHPSRFTLHLCAGAMLMALAVSFTAHAAGSIEKLQAFAEQTQSARTTFTQTVRDKDGSKVQTSSGTLSFARPGKFRWQYEKPYQQTIVGDGEKLWVYDKDLNQVTVKKLEGSLGSSPAALLAGSNDIEQYYNVDAKGSKNGLDWLEAFPRDQDSMFERVRMGFKGSNLDTMELYDHLGQVTVIRFGKVERNPKLAANVFTFTPPKGADVIEDK
jgi:outer membrane lipoprotein carrier protein